MTIYWGFPVGGSMQHAFRQNCDYPEVEVRTEIRARCDISFPDVWLRQLPNPEDDVCTECVRVLMREIQESASLTSTPTVDHPPHYGGADNPYEAIKVIEAWRLNFSLGSALKYLCRTGKKDGASTKEDLEKAVWYIRREIGRLP